MSIETLFVWDGIVVAKFMNITKMKIETAKPIHVLMSNNLKIAVAAGSGVGYLILNENFNFYFYVINHFNIFLILLLEIQ